MLTINNGNATELAISAVKPITASALADLVTCERRFHNDLHADAGGRDPVNGFVEMLWRDGNRHEAAIIAALGSQVVDLQGIPLPARAAATLSACEAGAPIVVGARFELGDRIGMPDLVMFVDGVAHAGDVKFGTPFAQNGVDPNRPYGVQIGFYARLLADGGWGSGDRAFVIGADGALVWFDTAARMRGGGPSIADQVEELTAKARGVRDRTIATSAAACSMCGLCVWKTVCKAELASADDLTQIVGLGRSARGLLSRIATSVTEVAALPMGAGAPKVAGVGAARLDTFVERARALRTPGARGYAVRPLGLARRDRELHLDLETDPTNGNLVYLHGVWERVRNGGLDEGRYVHFLAEDMAGERDAFAAAVAYLSADPDALITTFSAFERTTYRLLQRRYPEVATADEIEALFVAPRGLDLYFGAVLPSTAWPLGSLGLKAIARHLGFDWSDHEASGAASISWFVEWAETRAPALLERILTYNRDDCVASMVVFDGLIELPVGGPLPWPPTLQA